MILLWFWGQLVVWIAMSGNNVASLFCSLFVLCVLLSWPNRSFPKRMSLFWLVWDWIFESDWNQWPPGRVLQTGYNIQYLYQESCHHILSSQGCSPLSCRSWWRWGRAWGWPWPPSSPTGPTTSTSARYPASSWTRAGSASPTTPVAETSSPYRSMRTVSFIAKTVTL